MLDITGNHLADHAHINGVIFGATILSVATALPEISSGIAAVRLGDNELAVADIFGGNAFQVTLFLLADLIAGKPVLPTSGRQNSWLAIVGISLTVIYAYGVILRHERCVFRLGRDSMLAIVIFGLGIAGLVVAECAVGSAPCSRSTSCGRTSPPARSTPSSPAFTDMQGRLMGKRLDAEFFLDEREAGHGGEGCNYLLALEMEMDPVPGLRDRELGARLRRLRAARPTSRPCAASRGTRRR